MNYIMLTLIRFLPASLAVRLTADKRAVTAIEYALIAALVAVVIIAAASSLGQNIVKVFNTVSSQLSSAA
jgi:pilus assembly protein Flp/PilA